MRSLKTDGQARLLKNGGQRANAVPAEDCRNQPSFIMYQQFHISAIACGRSGATTIPIHTGM
jgi:hypothetical protein